MPGLGHQLLAAAELEQPAGAERGALQGCNRHHASSHTRQRSAAGQRIALPAAPGLVRAARPADHRLGRGESRQRVAVQQEHQPHAVDPAPGCTAVAAEQLPGRPAERRGLLRPVIQEPLGVQDQLLPGMCRIGAGRRHGGQAGDAFGPLGRDARRQLLPKVHGRRPGVGDGITVLHLCNCWSRLLLKLLRLLKLAGSGRLRLLNSC